VSTTNAAGIDPAILRKYYADGAELALVDAREEADFADKSIFFAVSLPLSRLELRAADLLPRRDVRIVVTDGAGEFAPRAADRLRALGYSNVAVLTGGVAAWEAAGHPVYSGVHVPSKAFAEVVEEHFHTPWIDVADLAQRLADGDNLVVLDSRTESEYRRAAVPGALSVPGAELLRHARDLAPDADTLVVVNCGGRTRSIIGAQALINAGLPNKVVSLKDGLLAWRLHGLVPEEGADRLPAPASANARAWGAEAARRAADDRGVGRLSQADYRRLGTDPQHTVYLLDVRSPVDYEAGHRRGAISAPGGQLVQEVDSYVAVHNAHVVLTDDSDLTRANVSAGWLVQLGLANVSVLEDGLGDGALDVGARLPVVLGLQEAALAGAVTPAALALELAADRATIVDIGLGPDHKIAHIPGAWLALRATLVSHLDALPRDRRIVLTSGDGILARIAAAELGNGVAWLDGGTAAWFAAGLPSTAGIERAIGGGGRDVWLSPTQCDGDRTLAARTYLAWELALAAAVETDPDVRFNLQGQKPGGNH
jgi:rhodanese-related sulfurtransferase